MTSHYRKVALACVLMFAAATASASNAQAQAWPSYGPSMATWTGPGGTRCFAGSWNGVGAYGAYNGRYQMQGQFCYGPQGFPGPWAGAYPNYQAYPMGQGAYPNYQPYPMRPGPYPSYPAYRTGPGAYPSYPAGPGDNRFYPGYGPQPFPYAYPSWAPRPFGY
ncbi:MAG: hypothetical protein ACLPPF_22535 [Rhodomicrobium sp.]